MTTTSRNSVPARINSASSRAHSLASGVNMYASGVAASASVNGGTRGGVAMITIDLVLIVASLACFVVAAFGVPSRVVLVPAGLALYMLSLLI